MANYTVAGIPVLHTPSSPTSAPEAKYDGIHEGQQVLPAGFRRTPHNRCFDVDTIWDRDVPLRTREGIVLRADVFRPSKTESRLPALVAWSPYGKSGTGVLDVTVVAGRAGIPLEMVSGFQSFESFDPAEWVVHGYAVVNVDAQGILASQGQHRWHGAAEGRAGYDAIEAIAQLSWCDGKVALMGNSWLASAQWFIAAERPPHLTCILPLEGLSDVYRETLCRGGVPYLPFWDFLGKTLFSDEPREDVIGMLHKYPLMNDYWEDKRAKAHLINVPAYVLASMSTGLHTVGSIRCFEDIPHENKWLRMNGTQEWHDLYQPEAVADFKKFLDYHMKQSANGWEETPRLRISILRYNQDPVSGVRHELEDLSDIKDRTVLVLNVEALDEVKRHIDEGIGQLKKIVQDVKQNVDDQGLAIQRVSERQQETATEMARLAATPPVASQPVEGSKSVGFAGGRKLAAGHLAEIQSLRRDLAVMRQAYAKFQSEIQGSMSTIRSKASSVKSAVVKASVPSIEGETGHAYVTKGREQLNSDSDRLVARVDDLQDLVEDLRKDVVLRGVRPLPRQLEAVAKDITMLSKELKKVEDYMKDEKPIWTKIWEKELEDVCKGRDELRLMEDLMVDLQDDLEKASETFALVEQATKEQMKDNGTSASAGTARTFSKGLNNLGNSLDQNAAKDGVLGEVRALQPNHENRLEAIERAEKLRQKELEGRKGNELQRELTNFVEEGKLKKSGGFEEVERARKAKDDKIRREVWERQNGLLAEDEEYEEVEEEEEEEEGEGEGEPGDANGIAAAGAGAEVEGVPPAPPAV